MRLLSARRNLMTDASGVPQSGRDLDEGILAAEGRPADSAAGHDRG
jgi:hypothetical protein